MQGFFAPWKKKGAGVIVSTMRSLILSSAILALFLSGCDKPAHVPVTIYGTSAGEGSGGVHIVQQDETMYSIAHRYNLILKDLAYANHIEAPYRITPGQRLKLPPPPTYRVRTGDSLSTVAQIFGVSTEKMIAVNGLPAPYVITPGQSLKLPRVTPEEASAGYSPVRLATASKAGVSKNSQDFVVSDVPASSASKSKPSAVRTQPPKRSSSRFLRPVDGEIISSYGTKKNGLHNDGVNIRAARGSSVKAAENGVVVYAGSELKGMGNLVLVRHSDRWMTAYGHLDKINVNRGDVLSRGQMLGTVGQTGSVDTPQLHFEVRRGTTAINPKQYL
tara:strand:+ start:608 stop:1603 length:996 start_codon:yes stop_codon:yes gene_type:complete